MGLEIRAGARSLATPISVQLVSQSVSQSFSQSSTKSVGPSGTLKEHCQSLAKSPIMFLKSGDRWCNRPLHPI